MYKVINVLVQPNIISVLREIMLYDGFISFDSTIRYFTAIGGDIPTKLYDLSSINLTKYNSAGFENGLLSIKQQILNDVNIDNRKEIIKNISECLNIPYFTFTTPLVLSKKLRFIDNLLFGYILAVLRTNDYIANNVVQPNKQRIVSLNISNAQDYKIIYNTNRFLSYIENLQARLIYEYYHSLSHLIFSGIGVTETVVINKIASHIIRGWSDCIKLKLYLIMKHNIENNNKAVNSQYMIYRKNDFKQISNISRLQYMMQVEELTNERLPSDDIILNFS
jgi:hypothetical protein